MKHVAFITCSDLSAYFPSEEDPLFTHDDYLAASYLRDKNYKVSPLVWGESTEQIESKNFDLLLIRSPWDYMDTNEKREAFTAWLKQLEKSTLKVLNPVGVMLWSLDKHYLQDFQKVGIDAVPSKFLEAKENFSLVKHFHKNGPFVLKPTVSAAAKDTFRFQREKEAKVFEEEFKALRKGRSFILQPYLKDIEDGGEWSLVFIGGTYSHGVLKKPKKGHWLVQDELGGSVNWERVPEKIKEKAKEAFKKIPEAYKEKNKEIQEIPPLAYARIDIIESQEKLYLSEVELIEPELFFLDRSKTPPVPHKKALEKLHHFLEKV